VTDLVYIASTSYSGSTLLTYLLNAHPAIGTMGELKWADIDLATYRCSCGQRLIDCPFWRRVESLVRQRDLPFDLARPYTDFRMRGQPFADRIIRARNRGRLFESMRDAAIAVIPACRLHWPTVEAVNRAMIEVILHLQGARVFVDASKDPVRLKYLIKTGDYNVRVIHLIRDGRGVTHSAIKNRGVGAEEAALDWLRTHQQIERFRDMLGHVRCMIVRYEDLCRDVQNTTRSIYQFAGVDASFWTDNFRSVPHHILGNTMRLRNNAQVRLDETWRTLLSHSDLATFEAVAGPQNRAFGYD